MSRKTRLLAAFGAHSGVGGGGVSLSAETSFFRKSVLPYAEDVLSNRGLRVFFETLLPLDFVIGSSFRPLGSGQFLIGGPFGIRLSSDEMHERIRNSKKIQDQDCGKNRLGRYRDENVCGSPSNVGGYAYWGIEDRLVRMAKRLGKPLEFENERTSVEVLFAELRVFDAYANLANYLKAKTGSASYVVSPLFGNDITLNYGFNSLDFWPAFDRLGSFDQECLSLIAKAFQAHAEYQFLRDGIFSKQVRGAADKNPDEDFVVVRGYAHSHMTKSFDPNIFDVKVALSSSKGHLSFFDDAHAEVFEQEDPTKVDFDRYARLFASQVERGAKLNLTLCEYLSLGVLRGFRFPGVSFIENATYGLTI